MQEELQRLAGLIDDWIWTFAKTMPKNPHYWTLLKHADPDDFKFAVEYINKHGEPYKFGSRIYTVLHLDGWRYWTMDEDLSKVTLINRAMD